MAQTPSPNARRPRLFVLTAVATCVAAAGGIGAWLLLGTDDDPGSCEGLLQDERVHEALGDNYTAGMSCSEFGTAIRKATVGSVPGQHSLRQAQTMKDILIAVEDNLESTEGRLDPILSAPLAESLADYAADTEVMLGIGNADYFANSSPSKPAWKDTEGVHMAVPRTSLLRTVRAVSQEPTAYVVLRMAATRHAAEGLAAVERGTTGAELTAPPTRNARTLGALDAVSEDVRRDLSEGQASRWEHDVFKGLTKKTSEPLSYAEDPVNHLVASWQQALLADGAGKSSATLEEQSADMVDAWGKALSLDSEVQNSLRKNSLDSSYHARGDALRDLD
ncbi:hypothetical protein GCM10010415_53480 [Streptomyces atrovirens]|uniref:Secreted protein n=1 Tax=Streptomyces atrovirens TaxID=285556 RepID=A0ABW0E052_9ACTN